MKIFGCSSVAEFLQDRIVFRNLAPADPRLPSLDRLYEQAGLLPGQIPRKTDPEYAQVIVQLLRQARALDAPGAGLRRLLYLGDTRMSDGTAFANLCAAGGWAGAAFIGSETNGPLEVNVQPVGTAQRLYLANRWPALEDFAGFCQAQELWVDESTAVVVDLDKTAIGARGRNAGTIDSARVQAVRDTVAGLLGPAFDEAAFRTAYNRLNAVEFHPFTADNQDYLAYVCLILGSGMVGLEEVEQEVRSGRLASFEQFIERVQAQRAALPGGLAEIHSQIYRRVQAGDPTPFKAFRRNEYIATIGRMGFLSDSTPVETLLQEEIVITQEVRCFALQCREQGALLFGLSDKPDEASTPTPELAAQGYAPIHRKVTHVAGYE